jgi:hypothetical protein
MSSSAVSTKPAEFCDFCHAALAEEHQHLLEATSRRVDCVCDPCAILFSDQNQKYRRIPRRVRFLPDFQMTDAQWDSLMIPIGIAFLVRTASTGRVAALYPSPAGPVESQLALETWDDIARDNPQLQRMDAEVEGLLVYRVGTAREHYIVPIDECFKLIGLIRLKWKGFSGGLEVWKEIGGFLETLKTKSSKPGGQ